MMNKSLFALAGLLCFISCQTPSTQEQSETTERLPNIIYILADDLGYGDLSFLGQSKFQTPNIDKLAKAGMVFTQHYSGSTVCAPSRSALMTGQHTGHTPIRGNKSFPPEGQMPLPDSVYNMAEMLKDVGYTTATVGKWGLGYPGSEGEPLKQGFDKYYGFNCHRLAHNYYPDHLWDNGEKVPFEGNLNGGTEVYAPDIIHEEAMRFIRTNKEKPFFLWYATIIPHAELLIDAARMAPFMGKLEPELNYKGYDEGPDYRKGPYGSQPYSHAAFAAMVTLLDEQVGEIVAEIEKLGLSEHTIIVFTSDNGAHAEGGADPEYFDSNGPYKGIKRDLYEGGIHVPMVISWPGTIQAGSETDHVSAFWDVMPTLADITHAKLPDDMDGISFLPTLLGKEGQQAHDHLYWEFHEKGGRQAIRAGKWKYIKYDIKADTPKVSLFDLSEDPYEDRDLAAELPEEVARLDSILLAARTPSPHFNFSSSTYLQEK